MTGTEVLDWLAALLGLTVQHTRADLAQAAVHGLTPAGCQEGARRASTGSRRDARRDG